MMMMILRSVTVLLLGMVDLMQWVQMALILKGQEKSGIVILRVRVLFLMWNMKSSIEWKLKIIFMKSQLS